MIIFYDFCHKNTKFRSFWHTKWSSSLWDTMAAWTIVVRLINWRFSNPKFFQILPNQTNFNVEISIIKTCNWQRIGEGTEWNSCPGIWQNQTWFQVGTACSEKIIFSNKKFKFLLWLSVKLSSYWSLGRWVAALALYFFVGVPNFHVVHICRVAIMLGFFIFWCSAVNSLI